MLMAGQTDFLKTEYDELVAKSINWKLRSLQSASTPHCIVDGKEVIMLCSNNYLNLSNHPKMKRAAIEAIRKYGVGSGSVRAIAGNMEIHERLEKKIADYKHTQGALIYQTGFAANAGLIPALAGQGDVVISDELNHGSIIDGVRLCKAERKVYKHNDMGDLERVLKESASFRRRLIITDGVFSMDGDIAKMDEIVKLAEANGAMTYVDDAHGEGVLGEQGRGIGSHYKIEGKIDVEMGTFSKAFGVVGGYVAGTNDLRNFAFNKSRTWLLSGSHPPAIAAASIAAIEVMENEPRHLKKLWGNTKYFKKRLQKMGFDTGVSQTPITPVIVKESEKAKRMSEMLFEEGVFALPIVFPMVAADKARIRTMMNSGLKKEDLEKALSAFEGIGKKLGVI